MSEPAAEVHELECARRLRWQRLAREGDPAQPSARLLGEIAERVHRCCGHSRLKAHRLAYGWTVEHAVEALHTMCDDEKLGARGLTAHSWLGWEAGGRPGPDYQDLLARLFRSGPVRLGFACDYSDNATAGNGRATPQPAGTVRIPLTVADATAVTLTDAGAQPTGTGQPPSSVDGGAQPRLALCSVARGQD